MPSESTPMTFRKPTIHLIKRETALNSWVFSSLQMMIFYNYTILQRWSRNRCFLTSIHLKSNKRDRASHNPK